MGGRLGHKGLGDRRVKQKVQEVKVSIFDLKEPHR